MKSTTKKQLKIQKTLNDLHDDLKRYQNIHNVVTQRMFPLWNIMMNHYAINRNQMPSNLIQYIVQYIGEFMTANTEFTAWNDYYAVQQEIAIEGEFQKVQIMVEKRVFDMDSDEMEEYLMTESATVLETAIEAFRRNNLLILKSIEENKFTKELNIDKFINIRKLIGGDIDE